MSKTDSITEEFDFTKPFVGCKIFFFWKIQALMNIIEV